MLGDEALKGGLVRGLDHLRPDALGGPVLHAGDRRLADRAAARAELLLGVLVLLPAAHVGLVGLDGPGHRQVLAFEESLADALHHEPGGRLPDAQVAVELHARRALDAGGHLVERDRPLLEPEGRRLHDRALAHREVLTAVLAAVRHRLAALDDGVAQGAAVRAESLAVGPALRLEPAFGRRVVGEHAEEFREGDAVSFAPSWAAHRSSLVGFRG